MESSISFQEYNLLRLLAGSGFLMHQLHSALRLYSGCLEQSSSRKIFRKIGIEKGLGSTLEVSWWITEEVR